MCLCERERERLQMSKIALGNESLAGSLIPSNKKSYKVTNRIQEGKKPLYALVFNFIDARFFSVFVTAGGNRVKKFRLLESPLRSRFWVCLGFDGDRFPNYKFLFFCLILGFLIVALRCCRSLVRKKLKLLLDRFLFKRTCLAH